jgi:N-acetyl-anhydromuramyl-L-alanine amidase AmpD
MTQINQDPRHQKNLKLKPGQGYSLRSGSEPYKSFVVHTTNGAAGTASSAELNFLVNSQNVSAHYLIGKDGVIYQILDPKYFVAWHAGEVSNSKYSNFYSIGVEVHFTPKEALWRGEMWAGLTRLARVYPELEFVTHRFIARPRGRKIDPSGVTDPQFTNWQTSFRNPHKLATLTVNTNLRAEPNFGNNIIQVLPKGLTVVVSAEPVTGAVYNNNQMWYYCNWLGYVHASLIEIRGDV